MKKLIYRLSLLASTAAMLGITTTATASLAQAGPSSEDVNFQGLVGNACIFSNIVDGTLEYDGNKKISASLFTGTYSGTPGSLHLSCNGSAEVSIGLPQDNGSAANIMTDAVNITTGFGYPDNTVAYHTLANGSTPSGIMAGPIDDVFTVGMSIQARDPIPDGTYSYTVTVTAAPQ